jgi:hypothetical protein
VSPPDTGNLRGGIQSKASRTEAVPKTAALAIAALLPGSM